MGKAEDHIEGYLVQRTLDARGECLKFISGVNGVPDRIVILAGHTLFVETKAPRGRLSAKQRLRIDQMREAGARIEIIWTRTQVDELIQHLLEHSIPISTAHPKLYQPTRAFTLPGADVSGTPASSTHSTTDTEQDTTNMSNKGVPMTPTTMHSLPTAISELPEILIYGPEECPNCDKAIETFTRANMPHRKIAIDKGDANYAYVNEELGYSTAPVIVVTFTDGKVVHWGGHRMDMLMGLRRLCRPLTQTDQG